LRATAEADLRHCGVVAQNGDIQYVIAESVNAEYVNTIEEGESMTTMFADSTGRHWNVAEAFRVGSGACGEGDPFPEAVHITIRFESHGETRWASNVPDDWKHPEILAELFSESSDR
jgi:hypothetical protein